MVGPPANVARADLAPEHRLGELERQCETEHPRPSNAVATRLGSGGAPRCDLLVGIIRVPSRWAPIDLGRQCERPRNAPHQPPAHYDSAKFAVALGTLMLPAITWSGKFRVRPTGSDHAVRLQVVRERQLQFQPKAKSSKVDVRRAFHSGPLRR